MCRRYFQFLSTKNVLKSETYLLGFLLFPRFFGLDLFAE